MSRKLPTLTAMATLLGGAATADVPNVAVDIAPVHSLVARIMEGVGEPDLIVPAGASPHEYSMRPSEARALQDADIVVWMGEGLTPWLENAVDTLAEDASVLTLLEVEETKLLEFRESVLFEAHNHDDHEGHDDHDDHEGHDDHDDHEGHDDHDDHEGHGDHGAHDPHAWLAPSNASAWLNVIAAELAAADPDNAGAYFTNAAAAKLELEALTAEITEKLDPVRGQSFVVFHDAYQYFETDFDFPASGAISLGDATDPSPARIAEIRARVENEGIECVLAEPQFNAGIVETVLSGTDARTGIIDPLGSELELGTSLYPTLIAGLADSLVSCL